MAANPLVVSQPNLAPRPAVETVMINTTSDKKSGVKKTDEAAAAKASAKGQYAGSS